MPAPIVPPPANDMGALTQPRTLQRWLDVNRITKLDRTQTFVTIPSFSIADSWNGYSDIVAVYDFEAPNNISLKGFTFPSNPNYTLTVAYQDLDGNPVRYLLFDATGSNLNMQLVTYSGQLLLKNFRFEVWNTSQGISSQSTDIVIYTSKLGDVDYRYGSDSTLVAAGAIVTDFDVDIPNAGIAQPSIDCFWKGNASIISSSPIDWASSDGSELTGVGSVGSNTEAVSMSPQVSTVGTMISSLAPVMMFAVIDTPVSLTTYDIGHWSGSVFTSNFRLTITSATSAKIEVSPNTNVTTVAFTSSPKLYFVWYFPTPASQVWKLDVFNIDGTLLGSGTGGTALYNDFSDFRASQQIAYIIHGDNTIYQTGFSTTVRNSQTMVNYLISINGWKLPLVFPTHSNILPQP